LRSLTYSNTNPEPTSGIRIIEIRVYDGVYYAQILLIIVVLRTNDNRVMLEAANVVVNLMISPEEIIELRVGQEAMLVLMDLDDEISSLQVTLSDRLDQSEEIRITNLNAVNSSYANETLIFINETMSVSTYQVRNFYICK